MPMMPAFPRTVGPAVPAVHTAPSKTAAPCEAAAVPARSVPAIKVEAIPTAFVHEHTHGDLIDETGFRAGQLVDGKTSCICLGRNQQRAGCNGQGEPPHGGILLLSPDAVQRADFVLVPLCSAAPKLICILKNRS